MTDFTPHEAAAHEAHALPVMVPGKLIGRDVVLATVYASLKENRAVAVHGLAGIGKSALAATLASAYTDLPGGVLWINVHNPSLADLLVHVGRAYRVNEITNSENPLGMVGAVASTLLFYKPLLVIDGPVDAAVARDFIARCADAVPALILSEDALEGPWTSLALSKLDADAAAQMFKHLAGMDGPEGEDNDTEIERLVRFVDGMPFGIAVSAGHIRSNRQAPGEFVASLPEQPGVSGQLLVLTVAFKGLNSALQGLMLMLGATNHGQASAELLSMISSAPLESIQQALNMLAQRHLVERFERYQRPYYRMHPITYAFMQPLLRGSGKLDSLREKVRDAVVTYAQTYSSATPPAYDHLAMEIDSMVAIAQWAAEHNDLETPNELAVALVQAGDFVNQRGYVSELLNLRRLATSSTSAFPAYEPSAPLPYDAMDDETEAGEETGAAEVVEGAFEEVIEDEALEVEDEGDLDAEVDDAPDPDEEPYPPLPYHILGEDEDDEEDFDRPLPIDELDEDEPASEPLIDLEPELSEPLGAQEPAEVIRLRQSLAQARQQGNQHRQSEILSQMASVQVQAAMENEAISSYSEALALYEELSDTRGILNTLETLAALTQKTENLQAAVLHATRGIQLAEQMNDRARLTRLLAILGDARQQLGESEQAVGAYALALETARALGDRDHEGLLLFRLGYAQMDESQPDTAIQTWEQALTLFKELNRRDLEGRVLGGLGTAYGELGRWTEAIAFYTSALFIAREVGDKEDEALQLSNLGYAAVQAQQLGQAVLRYRQALHLAYVTDSRDNIISAIVDLIELLVESPRHLKIAEMLIDEAIRVDPNDRNLKRWKERIDDEIEAAVASGMQWQPVSGTVQDYAANAYALLT